MPTQGGSIRLFRVAGIGHAPSDEPGEARTVAVTAFPLLTQHDEPSGLVCIFWERSGE